MDSNTLKEMTKLLEPLEQPVFYVRQGRIVYANRAAQALELTQGTEILPLLGESTEFYLSGAAQGALMLNLQIAGQNCEAAVERVEDVDVFSLRQNRQPEAAAADAMAAIAQTMRLPLTNLFATASSLFPYLEEREDPKIQSQTAALNRSFYQLLRIAGNLTDSDELLQGEAAFYAEKTELREFFSELAEKVRPLCEISGKHFVFACPARSFSGVVDRQKLERAALNLLSNAMKFTPRGGTIRLQIEVTRSQVLIKVTDDGEGMDSGLLATVFNRYTNRNVVGDPRWGVGLGLPLVRKIAELHGGTVILQSVPGEGTSVTMSISLRTEEDGTILKTPMVNYDYAGGYSHVMVELSDALPVELFDSINLS